MIIHVLNKAKVAYGRESGRGQIRLDARQGIAAQADFPIVFAIKPIAPPRNGGIDGPNKKLCFKMEQINFKTQIPGRVRDAEDHRLVGHPNRFPQGGNKEFTGQMLQHMKTNSHINKESVFLSLES